MNDVLRRLADRVGVDPTRASLGPSNSASTRIFRSVGVEHTPELDRILSLPRRKWEEQAEHYARAYTAHLRTPMGTMHLRPIQGAALHELVTYRGLFAPINVGGGKTAISLLAPQVTQAKRPILLIPAKLRSKTQHEMQEYARHFKVARRLKIISYEIMSRANRANLLEHERPDLIIADEAHKLKNTKAAVTKRVRRYLEKNPECMFVAMSGTITRRSLRDFWHLIRWALRDQAPIPRSFGDLMAWSLAIDEIKNPNAVPMAPGALMLMWDQEEEGDPVTKTRRAYQRRLRETPGVIATSMDTDTLPSLSISSIIVEPAPVISSHFITLRNEWTTPDGWALADAVQVWRHARELSCGFFYKWDPRPPYEWIEARREWAADCRAILKENKRALDTELQVAQAIARGEYNVPSYWQWREIRDSFKPNSVPVWIDDTMVDFAARWAKRNAGLIWTEHIAFGTRLEERHSIPFFSRGGRNGRGEEIERALPRVACLSISSNQEGRNLQHYSANLVITAPPNGTQWEQMIGRTHRYGQQADEVSFDVVFACIEQYMGFEQARKDARYIQDTTGQPQKIIYGDIAVEEAPISGVLWTK